MTGKRVGLAIGTVGACAALLATSGFVSVTAASMHKEAMKKLTMAQVSVVMVDKTAQTVQAAPTNFSAKDEATFVLTAKLSNGKPAANEPVAFYVGPMKPLSGVAPKAWYASGTKAGAHYIASYTAKTDADGQARVVLYGQRADSMEMVGVRVGNLDSYSVKAGKALGSLDAWWTTAKSRPTAPIGDYVRVTPFLASTSGMAKEKLTIGVFDGMGRPIPGTHVSVAAKSATKASGSLSMGMSAGMSSSGSMGMSATGGLMLTTGMSGEVTTQIAVSGKASMEPVRIVVTQASGKARITGGMNALLFVNGK